MKILFFSLFILCLVIGVPEAFGRVDQACGALFQGRSWEQFKPKRGFRIDDWGELKGIVTPRSQIWLLGTGIGGGEVYRVTETTGSAPRTFKYYLHSRNDEKDIQRIRVLEAAKAWIDAARQGQASLFEVASYQRVRPQLVEVQNIEGRALDQLLERLLKESNGEAVFQLQKRYQEILQALEDYFVSSGTLIEKNEHYLKVFDSFLKEEILLIIHEGNVVVEPGSLRMTIIDPY